MFKEDIRHAKSLIAHLVRDENPELCIVDCLKMIKGATQDKISDLIEECAQYYVLVKVGEHGLEKVKAEGMVVDDVVGYEIIDNSGKSSYYVLTPEYQTLPT